MLAETMSRARAGGIIAALAVFVVALALQDGLRDDLSATRHWVSHLSLGPWGWAGIASLLLAGAAAAAIVRPFRVATPSRWPSACFALGFVTASAMAAAAFAADGPALPSGIAERTALLAGLGWLAILAHRLSKRKDR